MTCTLMNRLDPCRLLLLTSGLQILDGRRNLE
jgi:hypothetical protein